MFVMCGIVKRIRFRLFVGEGIFRFKSVAHTTILIDRRYLTAIAVPTKTVPTPIGKKSTTPLVLSLGDFTVAIYHTEKGIVELMCYAKNTMRVNLGSSASRQAEAETLYCAENLTELLSGPWKGDPSVEGRCACYRVQQLARHYRSKPQTGFPDSASSPRSSNRMCSFPAFGFPTTSRLRFRMRFVLEFPNLL